MLKYYSYYSVGGYKDFMLGNSDSNEEATYYFPLLPVLEERAKTDAEAAKQVADLKRLPQIYQLSADDTYGLPDSARVLFSHAGYKLIYKHLEGDKYALALRDIPNKFKDDAGRSIPFLFVIVGDTNADVRTLDILATYMASHIRTVESLLPQFIYMDMEKNGLRFELAKLNSWISTIVSKCQSNTLPSILGVVKIHAYRSKVALLVLPNGISKEKAVLEQKINTEDMVTMKESDIISKEDPDKLVEQLMSVLEELKAERKKSELIKKSAIAAGIGGFIIGAVIASCSHK